MKVSKRYKRFVESLGNEYFFYSHNLDGKYLFISPSVESVLGYSVEEAFEGIVKHMTDSELNKNTIETLKKSASGEKQKTFELELYTKDRKIKVIEITESPLYDDEDNVVSIEGIAHDITERKRQEDTIKKQNENLQKQDDELRKNLEDLVAGNKRIDQLKKEIEDRHKLLLNIINEIPEKIYVKDDEGKFVIANTPVASNFGLTPEELIGKSDFDFYPSEDAEKKFNREKEMIAGGKAISFEEGSFDKEDGLIVKTKIKPFKIAESEKQGLLGIQLDITQIRKNEQELKAQKEELENTIQNLRETQSQLVQSEKMGALGKLVAGIAHEINTPIGAINASVDNIMISLDAAVQNIFTLFTKLTKSELIVFLRILELMKDDTPSLTSKEKRHYKKEIKARLDEQGCEHSTSMADLIIYLNLHNEIDELITILDVENPEFVLKSVKDIYSVRKNAENIKMAVGKASKVVFALKKFSHKDQGGDKERANIIDNIETVLTLHHNRLKQGIEVIKEFDAHFRAGEYGLKGSFEEMVLSINKKEPDKSFADSYFYHAGSFLNAIKNKRYSHVS